MARILRTLKKQPIPSKVEGMDLLMQACNASPLGAQMATQLADLSAKTAAAKSAYDAAQAGQTEAIRLTASMHDADVALNNSYDSCVDHAQALTGGDPDQIARLGMQSYAGGPGAIAGTLPQMQQVSATCGAFPGTAQVVGEKIHGAKTYLVQVCADPPTEAGWRLVSASPKHALTVEGLARGSTQWFRMAAVGTQGVRGPWSKPVPLVVQ